MARQALNAQEAVPAGLAPTLSAAHVDGHAVPNNGGRTKIVIVNGNAAAGVTATIASTLQRGGLALASRTVAVAAQTTKIIGNLSPEVHEQSGSDAGKVYVTFGGSDVLTDVDLYAIV